MDLKTPIKFTDYKQESCLEPKKDYFYYHQQYGASEAGFFEWLSANRLFRKRFCEDKLPFDSDLIQIGASAWYRYTTRYENFCLSSFIVEEYPPGYFECKSENGRVATFLPEPSNEGEYRISYYTAGGPLSHSVFNDRTEALTELASGRYKHSEGALEAISGTLRWDRGVTVAGWLSEGLHPDDGFKRDRNLSHVQREFAELY